MITSVKLSLSPTAAFLFFKVFWTWSTSADMSADRSQNRNIVEIHFNDSKSASTVWIGPVIHYLLNLTQINKKVTIIYASFFFHRRYEECTVRKMQQIMS